MLFGPTGGYLIGYLLASLLIGSLLKKGAWSYWYVIVINFLGFILALIIGSFWLSAVANLTITQGFASGFLPFLLPEMIKAVGVGMLAVWLKRRLPEKYFYFV